MLALLFLNVSYTLFRVYVKDPVLKNAYVFVCNLNLCISYDGALMRVYIKGFGCSSSFADKEVLAGCLQAAGHTIIENPQNAEVVIYNTCAVKTPTENRMINLLKRVPKDKKLIVAGCLPLINLKRLKQEVHFDGVIGPAFGERIVEVIRKVSRGIHVVELTEAAMNMPRLDLPYLRINPKTSIIPISYGCTGSCTYCCVRFARGKLRSYHIEDIVNRVERDVSEGICEFWLTSQDTACYGKDRGFTLAELLQCVCSVKGNFFIRVGMMTPDNFLNIIDRLLEAFRHKKVFKFLHLPIQSGDDGVLRRMNRLYSVKDFVNVVKRFRRAFPQSTLATDVIVGFPGETKDAFNRTWKLIENIRPDITNISKFFLRPETSATNLKPCIPPLEVKHRSALLAKLARHIAFERNSIWKNWSGEILINEIGKAESVIGRNFAYKPVVIRHINGSKCARNLLGKSVSVRIIDIFQSYLAGEIMKNTC
ncbi:MAG: tRNA (N(6)-L-threonylcarbamoyladenosine(37)-C(2))-methylthiotransferase [Candidatus Bathyarchaeota archaeon]|nr:MAG: tRNA (N(6)-L-threonylcarbamoyladenosine(37)-C(2))-methylthiotransferase [Candidatus Bathyarchaeota archaeon]